jgi:nucleotide-binding universal stress UspA family protein
MENAPARHRIVVGVDGSEASKEALRWAARISVGINAPIEAVIAWDYPVSVGWATWPGDWHPEADADKTLQQALDEAFGSDRPAGLEPKVRQGHPRAVLLDAAEGADMLILGNRGHGGFVGLRLGSVGAACAEHARCPVLVVHADVD